jgi:hypothetical protein
VRFVLLAEGRTEKQAVGKFLKGWLDDQLKPSNVGMHVESFAGSGKFVREFAKRAQFHLSSPACGEIIGVVGLLDFYGCPTPAEQSRFEREVGSPKFRMFFAVHEAEAWLLSQPDIFPRTVQDALPSRASERPETVDLHEPPSKLLDAIYCSRCNRRYEKLMHGRRLFEKLSADVARGKCQKLCEMLDAMLDMAKAAGL